MCLHVLVARGKSVSATHNSAQTPGCRSTRTAALPARSWSFLSKSPRCPSPKFPHPLSLPHTFPTSGPPYSCHIMAQGMAKRTSPYANDKMFYKNFEGGYVSAEYFWRDHQSWLQQQGYMLRPRYHPDWKPSWEGTKKYYEDFEDGLVPMVCPARPQSLSTVLIYEVY